MPAESSGSINAESPRVVRLFNRVRANRSYALMSLGRVFDIVIMNLKRREILTNHGEKDVKICGGGKKRHVEPEKSPM